MSSNETATRGGGGSPPAPPASSVDLTDQRFFVERGGHHHLRALQAADPVHHHVPPGRDRGFWVITRYDDAKRVLKDRADFASGRGNMLDPLLAGGDPAGGRLLALMEPPEHGALRSALLPRSDPSRVDGLAEAVRRKAAELVDVAMSAGECDFGQVVSDVLPASTVCFLLGVPTADVPELVALSHEAIGSTRADRLPGEAWSARVEMLRYFRGLLHRSEPAGMIEALVRAEPRGRRLTEDEIILNCYGLVLAGDETTRLCLNTAVAAFAREPSWWESVADGPVNVDELLRWASPARHVARTAQADVELRGRRISRGDVVTAWIATANRDPAMWANADELDWGRSAGAHLGLGFGAHYCLGAALARLEISAVLSHLRRRCRRLELTGDPAPIYSTFLNGVATAPVRLVPA